MFRASCSDTEDGNGVVVVVVVVTDMNGDDGVEVVEGGP